MVDEGSVGRKAHNLMFRAYWIMPSGPFKAEAFSELSRRARFSRTPAKVASVSIGAHIALA